MNDKYGRCETCRFYGKEIVCDDCSEGSMYEYEDQDFHDARAIVKGLLRTSAAPIPYDNDYANNECPHLWYKVSTQEELNALAKVYGQSGSVLREPEWICIIDDSNTLDEEQMDPNSIKQESVEDGWSEYEGIRFFSLREAKVYFADLCKTLESAEKGGMP